MAEVAPPSSAARRPDAWGEQISVVIITQDQASNVDAILSGVLDDLKACGGGEIVVVDSASRDDTLARAARHPVGLVRLDADQLLTPALGRWLGTRLTRCGAVLFLDGDMQLSPGWLVQARRVLDADAEVGCVSGVIVWGPPSRAGTDGEAASHDVPWFRGAALVRREVLEAVGSFNPVMRSEEESELSMRIRSAGYRIVHLERPIATHPVSDLDPVRAILARRRRGLYLGFGQALKLHLGSRSGLEYLRGRAFWAAPLVGAMTVPLVGFAFRRSGRRRLCLAGVLAAAAAAHALRRKGSIRDAAGGVVSRFAILEGALRGLALETTPGPGFAPRFDVVREAPLVQGGS
jgi:hypothetical protein